MIKKLIRNSKKSQQKLVRDQVTRYMAVSMGTPLCFLLLLVNITMTYFLLFFSLRRNHLCMPAV